MSTDNPRYIVPELTDEMREEIATFAMAQMTSEQIGYMLGMDQEVFSEFKAKYPEIKIIMKKNKNKMVHHVAKALLYNAIQMKDTPAIKFFLERKGGWHQKNQVEVTGKNGQPLQAITANVNRNMTPEEARQFYYDMCNEGKQSQK